MKENIFSNCSVILLVANTVLFKEFTDP